MTPPNLKKNFSLASLLGLEVVVIPPVAEGELKLDVEYCRYTHSSLSLSFSLSLCVCVCVCVWSAVGNGSVPVGSVVRLVHPIRAPLPPQRAMWRGFGEAR